MTEERLSAPEIAARPSVMPGHGCPMDGTARRCPDVHAVSERGAKMWMAERGHDEGKQ
jgi:hypothetical protein